MKQYSLVVSSYLHRTRACFSAAALAIFLVGLSLFLAAPAHAAPGDQWILPLNTNLTQGSFFVWPGAGYDGASAYEFFINNGSPDGTHRVYWDLDGLSLFTSNAVPTSAQLYTIEWYVPTGGNPEDWQPIESQFEGSAGETYPIDPNIPWAGEYGTDHQYIGAQSSSTTDDGTWLATGPGPHTPQSSAYNCPGDNGLYMWLRRGSYLYAKWDFTFAIDHTWSALRLTQVTPVVILSVTNSSHNIDLTWSTIPGLNYQLQYSTNLVHPTWNNIGGSLPAGGYTLSGTDATPPDAHRFYRVVQQ